MADGGQRGIVGRHERAGTRPAPARGGGASGRQKTCPYKWPEAVAEGVGLLEGLKAIMEGRTAGLRPFSEL